jgi:hypothetical protein
LTLILNLTLRSLGGSLRRLILRLRCDAQPQEQPNRKNRLKKPHAMQLNGIH